MRSMLAVGLSCLGAAAFMPVTAAENPSLKQKSMTAGYKAMFTCSATFNAGRSMAQIRGGELHRMYVDLRPFRDSVPEPTIHRDDRYVSVPFAEDMPPRISAWRPRLGCAALPPGAGREAISALPRIELDGAPADIAAKRWPIGDETADAPLPQGIDGQDLDAAVRRAFDREAYGEGTLTTAILVVHDGRIVAERYADGFDKYTSQRTWSVAKSIAATVIAAAIQRDLLELDAPAPVPEWSAATDPRGDITLADLLHMSSGLTSQGNRTDFIYFGGGTVTQHATKNPLEAPPGTRWKYANNDTMLAVRALRAAMGEDRKYLRFPFEAVLHRIGMYHTNPETDWQGNFVFSSQVWTTARDLGRLGLLYLNRGVWEGERIFPDWWADYVRTPAPDQPPEKGSDGDPIPGYGAQFWLFNERFPELPDDTHAMLGHRGQWVVLVPSRDTVIVRRGFDESGGTRFDGASFTRDVLAELPKP